MRKLILGVTLIFLITGCAFLKDQKLNFDTCMADPDCKSQAEAWQDRVETSSVIIASAVPVPGAAAAPKVLGYIALGLAALIGGRSLRKKKENDGVV